MKTDKQLDIKRLVIYYLIALAPIAVITPILNYFNGGPIFADFSVADMNISAYVMGVFGMFAPSVAVIITRLITKEGWKDTYLGLNFKGNGKYYAFVILYCIASIFIDFALLMRFFPGRSFSDVFVTDNMTMVVFAYILQMLSSIYLFFPAFGEEWGWRGYMMPKLMKLMPKPAAIIVGGILWGLWHAPLTISGHNFGLDYKGFPYFGILLMCIFCTIINIILTILTEKTKSIYPASFCHMLNNNMSVGVLVTVFTVSEEDAAVLNAVNNVDLFMLAMAKLVIGSAAIILLTCLGKKKYVPAE